jgi:hypothetical protein
MPPCRCAGSEDNIWSTRNDFGRVCANGIIIGGACTIIDPHIAAVSPTELAQLVAKCGELRLSDRISFGVIVEHADAPHRILLRARRERPRRAA